MLKQISWNSLHLCIGKKIEKVSGSSDSAFIVFDDKTYVAFESRTCYDATYIDNINITLDPRKGFGGYCPETCVELGIFTQEEYDAAMTQQEEIESKRRVEYWRAEHERLGKLIEAAEQQENEGFMFGYCKLCRAKEIELYGISATSLTTHKKACEAAGCKHPVAYRK